MPLKPFAVLPVAIGTVATGNERTETPASSLGLFKSAGLLWRSNGNANLWVRGQFSASQAIDFIALLNSNALSGTTIRVRLGTSQAQVDGTAPYDSGTVTFINPAVTRESGRYHSHLEIGSVQNATWWRIDIAGHTGDFEASHLVMGKRFQPARYYDRGFEFGSDDLGGLDISRWGVASEDDGLILPTITFKLGWLTEAEFETSMRPMINKLGKRAPVYWCFDPEATTYRQDRSYFGRMKQLMTATNIAKPKTYSIEFALQSMI